MKTSPEYPPAYRPADFVRGYSRDLIVEHLDECLSIFAELDEKHDVPPAIAPSVFGVVQTMVASVEPSPEKMRELQAAARLAPGNGLSLAGG